MNCCFTICVDMDDTIVSLVPAWIDWLNRKHKTNVQYENVTDWDISKFFPTIKPTEVFEPLFDDSFWYYVEPREGALHYVKKLIDDGHKVYICTSSHYKTLISKLENCLFKHFPYISWKEVIICHNKQLMNCDYLVDDGVHNIVGPYKGLLMDAPHNRRFVEHNNNITRVYNWQEVYEIIKKASCNEHS